MSEYESMTWTDTTSGIVVLATDGSAAALAATMRAIEYAKKEKKQVHVITVPDQSPRVGVEKMAENYAVGRTCKVDGVWFADKYATERRVPLTTVVREGPVAGVIVAYAASQNADLIVLGSSGLKGLAGFVLGDVSEAVLRLSHCSVWAVKPDKTEMQAVVAQVKQYDRPAPVKETNGIIPDQKKWRVGLAMFTGYAILYAAFTGFGTVMTDVLATRMLGMNLAIIFGMVIIIAAIGIALAYNWYAGIRESEA